MKNDTPVQKSLRLKQQLEEEWSRQSTMMKHKTLLGIWEIKKKR